ncbi:cupin [Bosea sp. Root483D1]|uniref:cupin n=1 Tax=Bosea sp. Root483D1 TaxID=1736544 RepID=UPI00070CBD1C|nr:cupin [Bosea sp. Root483D1]KRE20423.1 cupin [Bosea sp. Root483D1]
MAVPTILVLPFEERGPIPNNPRFPALVYQQAFRPDQADLAGTMERRFEDNGWPPAWRNGIYDFHHYHSKGHEVLGIAKGSAELVLGGGGGRELGVSAGDVVLLPAGTGHRRLNASGDFLVVGAYPPGQSGDILRDVATVEIRAAIGRLGRPTTDPVSGRQGPMVEHWSDGR